MPIAAVTLADTHTMHVFGLTSPDDAKLTPVQEWMWECQEHAQTVWLPSVIGKMERVFMHVGDAVEGVHHDQSGLQGNDRVEQVKAAARVLQPWTEGTTLRLMCAGTCAHAGAMGEYDNLVAELIGAEPDSSGRFAPFGVLYSIDGVLFHLSHHIGGSYVDSSDMTPLVGEWLAMAAASIDHTCPMPDVIVRGHSHLWRTPYTRDGKTVIAMMGWQARTPYAWKSRRARAGPADIGLCVVICDKGKYTIEHKLYEWPQPTIRSYGWTPQATLPQSSAVSNSQPGSQPSILSRFLRRSNVVIPAKSGENAGA